METDWSVLAGADDPVIELPWGDNASETAWMDLRVDAEAQPARIAALPEVAASPALAKSLAMLNAPQGLLLTTKCDRWRLSHEERSELAEILDAPMPAYGYGSYIDVLMAHAKPMADFLMHEEWARLTALRCAALPGEDARMEVVVRPARCHDVWGYGVTLYCYAGGVDGASAEAGWERALEQTVPVLIAVGESLLANPDEIVSKPRLS